MRFWLIEIGEPLPTDTGNDRLLRTGMLANELVSKGHEIHWWCSTFDHFRKQHRFEKNASVDLSTRLRLRFIHGPGYKKNISLQRIRHHRVLAQEFTKLIQDEPPPDLILCSMPTIELSHVATTYGQQKQIPVVLDLRDMWPDVYLDGLPQILRPLAQPMLRRFYRELKIACKQAHALCGITPEFVQWGLQHAGRPLSTNDRHFWHSYSQAQPSQAQLDQAQNFWLQKSLDPKQDFIACFFGTMSLEITPIILAAKRLKALKQNIKFVLCGRGDRLEEYRRLATGCNNIIFPGWVGRPEILQLMRFSSVGLAPYPSRKDFVISIPNKIVEYLSAGLPVLSSLQGKVRTLLGSKVCGLTYQNNDDDDLLDKLMILFNDPQLRKQMGNHSKKVFEEQFDAKTIFPKMARYLEQSHHCFQQGQSFSSIQ